MKALGLLVLGTLCAGAAAAQTAPARLEFEVASVKPSAERADSSVEVGLHIDGAQVHISSVSLKDYIYMAYHVKSYQVVGPDWMAAARYDVDAKLPAGGSRAQVPDMLQSLLADRFQLKIHRENRDMPIYALVVSGPAKFKEVPPDPGDPPTPTAGDVLNVAVSGGRQGVSFNYGHGSSFAFGDNKFEAKKVTMVMCADALSRFLDRPVVDMTNLAGLYDFTLPLSEEDSRALLIRSAVSAGVQLPPQALQLLEGNTDASLFSAVHDVGLKLDPRKTPLEAIVVDSVLKTPTDN
ncbi:MAG TPA: TIGR03435 family protein [Bryobacteraceae bacterium]|nr:TIGR03435 family protein [Bryobacteraceae bacterium]